MRHEEHHPNRRDWLLVFLLGLPLGLLVLGVFVVTLAHAAQLSPWNAVLFVWLMYFLSAGIIEYLFCWRGRHEGQDNSGAGFIVALVGCACFMLSAAALMIVSLIISDNTPHPYDPRLYGSPAFDRSITLIVLLLLAFLNVVGLAFIAGGARVGGALAMARVKRYQAREQRIS